MSIRPATSHDREAVWHILEPVFRAGETYAVDPAISRQDALAYWMGGDSEAFVFEDAGAVLGTYYLRPNHGGGGAHVCNCGYITATAAAGRGIARQMGEDSLRRARERGFRAMQFNFVVASNVHAVHLWETLGFAAVGRLPNAFDHPARGMVDALIMYRQL